MFEISIYNKNHKGECTTKVVKTFLKASEMADWYDKQRGHSITREYTEFHNKIPVINLNKPTKSVKENQHG